MENVNNNNEELMELLRAVPPGFKFNPSDVEVIRFFLINKINGVYFPWLDMMQEFDVYGERAPWDLIRWDDSLYVFSLSKNISKGRKQRTCRFGTWKLQKNDVNFIKHEGKTIGSKALLTFTPNKESIEYHDQFGGSWHMNEFCLADSMDKQSFVVCKVTFRSEDKNKKRSRQDEMIKNENLAFKKARVASSSSSSGQVVERFSNSAINVPPYSSSNRRSVQNVQRFSQVVSEGPQSSSSNRKSKQVVQRFSEVVPEEPQSSSSNMKPAQVVQRFCKEESAEPQSCSVITNGAEILIQGGGGAESVQQTIDEGYNQDLLFGISEMEFNFDEVVQYFDDNNPDPTTFTDMIIQSTTERDADCSEETANLFKNL